MNEFTKEQIEAIQAKVAKAEKMQNPFTAKLGTFMIYIINNN